MYDNNESNNKIADETFVNYPLILSKLQKNEYSSVENWANECSKKWNTILDANYDKKSLIYMIAEEQNKWFKRKLIHINHSKSDVWREKVHNVSKEMNKLAFCSSDFVMNKFK